MATPPLLRLAEMVRPADTGRPRSFAGSARIVAASLGIADVDDDLEQLEAGLLLYDAFYRWVATPQGKPQLAGEQGRAMIDDVADPKKAKPMRGTASASGKPFGLAQFALLSFGGPAGQIAVMHRILVDEKTGFAKAGFCTRSTTACCCPDRRRSSLRSILAGCCTGPRRHPGRRTFRPSRPRLPLALSPIYAAYGNASFVEALFFGLKAAVLAIVFQAVVRVGKRALRNRIMIGLAAAAFIAIFFFNVPFPVIIIAAGVIGYIGAKAGRPELPPSNMAAAKNAAAIDGMLGDEFPDHVRPTVPRALKVSAVWLLLWLVPVLRC